MKIAVMLALGLGMFLSVLSTTHGQSKSGDEPFVADYYYKAKWGFADEFILLF